MADVTGLIGNEQVELNNAATEATLRLLLQATLATTKEQKDNLAKMIKQSGLDPTVVQEVNDNLTDLTVDSQALNKEVKQLKSAIWDARTNFVNSFTQFTEKFSSGTATASDLLGEFAKLSPVLGPFVAGLQAVAKFQETSLAAYRQMTTAGVNFGGSLTDLRLAASNSYMTLDGFTKLMTNNSETLARMGGSVNDGAVAFAKLNQSLIKSEFGDRLLALGYTFDQINEGTASYLTMSGARTKKEMENTDALIQGATTYMQQLDGLAKITGQSREQQEKQLKEQAQNAAFQAKLATMSEKDREKALAGMANALAIGGKGAADAFQSKIMGVPPLTKEAQLFTATMSEANDAVMKSADAAMDSGKTMKDMNQLFVQGATGLQRDMSKFSIEQRAAMIAAGGPLADLMQKAGMTAQAFESLTEQEKLALLEKKMNESKQAESAAQLEKDMKELAQSLMNLASIVLPPLMTALNVVVGGIIKLSNYLGGIPAVILALVVALKTYTAAVVPLKDRLSQVLGLGGGGGRTTVPRGAPPAPPTPPGGGAGGGLSAFIKGIGSGLAAIGAKAPLVIAGAAAVGAAIALIGAGIAGATWIMGKALPTLAEGMKSFAELPGENLIKVGAGVAALGAGLAIFGAGSPLAAAGTIVGSLVEGVGKLFGAKTPVDKIREYAELGPSLSLAGKGMQEFSNGLAKLAATDISQLNNVSKAMINLKNSIPSLTTLTLAGAALALAGQKSTPTEPAATTPAATTPTTSPEIKTETPTEKLVNEMQTLNKQTAEMLRLLRETADYTRRNVDATKALNGNLFATV